MFSTRRILAVTALSAVVLLTGCSGSDDPDEPAADTQSPASGATEAVVDPFERTCDVTVELSGAVTASWQGKGRSSNEAGPTMYQFSEGDDLVNVFAGNDSITTNANVTVEGATYTTTDPDTGLDVKVDGSSAEVDADTVGVDGDGPHVTASFTCAKGGKSKK